MKILLIHPEYPATFWSFKYVLRFISRKAAFPPLGLITVAGLLPRDWDIRLIDLNIEQLKDRDIEWADYVMISAMLIQKKSVHGILERCRNLGIKIIAGGPLFNSCAEEFIPCVDHLILNEAELTLPPFLEDLKKGALKKIYRSANYPSLTLTPVPRWELVKIKKYASLMIQCSRGCPFDCEFCDITAMYGRKPRIKSTDQIIAELDTIYKLGWRDRIFIVDDNFIGNKQHIKKILSKMVTWMKDQKYPFNLLTETSVNLADDDDLIELMAEAGFDTVFIGLETPDEKSLRECEKTQNCSRDLVASIQKLQSAGIQVLGGYIVGFDNDDEDIFSQQINFIQKSGVVTAMVGLLNALPNTRLWKRLQEDGRLLINTTGDNTDGTINFIPKMDGEKLMEGYRRIIKTIYSPRHFYQRVCRFLEQYQPRRRKRIHWYQIKAFIKSLFYLGILGNGQSQWYYWKLLIKSMIFYRRSFAEAVTLLVYGHHFRKIAKKV